MTERLAPATRGITERSFGALGSRPDPPRVVVVGGGLAGLAAAVALADRGLRLTVLESRPWLGGRAGSFSDPAVGGWVDLCQHVAMGCCTNLEDYCARIGTQNQFRTLPGVRFLARDAPPSIWKADPLPAPLHLARAFWSSRFLSWGDKVRIAQALGRLIRSRPSQPRPIGLWLSEHGQTPRTIRRFWEPILVSALNDRLDRLDLASARQVFVDGFVKNRHAHIVRIPTVPLARVIGEPAAAWLRARGVELRTGVAAVGIECEPEGAVERVRLRDGGAIEADFVVLAVPFHRVADLVGAALRARIPALAHLDQFQAMPITGIHLWFDQMVVPVDHAALIDLTLHWVFNHGKFSTATASGQYVQCVVSASTELAAQPNEAVIRIALDDLARFWPEARPERLRAWRVVTEHRATFAPRPGIERIRPPQRTSIDGLFLAGDWTQTGWPSTMEGAVRSGYLAAEAILQDLGRPASILAPDLPAEPLAAWLLREPTRPNENRDRPASSRPVHPGHPAQPCRDPLSRSVRP
ncbi:MAG: phytoene dehydrogenase [Isosphaeraceae bacterium]|jgi:squalene-associated FAD-dependent desaturase|nr:MAG: phytoene dehydrogenase [Isosphaeraceae bacterium]